MLQPHERPFAEGRNIDRFPMDKRTPCSDPMQTTHEAPDALEYTGIVQLWRPSPPALKQGKPMASMVMQRRSAQRHGRDRRNLGRRKFRHEIMLLLNRRIGPAPRPIKLRDQKSVVGSVALNPKLIDPVFEAVERHQTPIAPRADRLNRVHDRIRRQIDKGRFSRFALCHTFPLMIHQVALIWEFCWDISDSSAIKSPTLFRIYGELIISKKM